MEKFGATSGSDKKAKKQQNFSTQNDAF